MYETHPGDDGVRSHHDEAVRAVDVGKWLQEREPVHALGDDELIVAVLRTGLEEVARPEALAETGSENRREEVEAERVSEIGRHGIAAMGGEEGPQLAANLAECLLPGDRQESVADTFERR